MGVPRAHSTRGQKGRRRSHLALSLKSLTPCLRCKKPKLPHRMCANCGHYGDKEVINVIARELKKKEKKSKRQK